VKRRSFLHHPGLVSGCHEPELEALVLPRFRKQIRDGAVNFVFAHDGLEALLYLQGSRASTSSTGRRVRFYLATPALTACQTLSFRAIKAGAGKAPGGCVLL
jgi:hypothetical protein